MRLPPRWLRIPLTSLLVYALYVGAAWFWQDALIYGRGVASRRAAPDPLPFRAERLAITIPEGGEVEAWFVPGVNVDAQNPGPAVLFVHGSGEVMDDWPFLLDDYFAWA